MQKIGITGSIATGKSFITKNFLMRRFPYFSSDEAVKNLLDNPKIIEKISDQIPGVLNENSQLDKKILRTKVFENKKYLKLLENILYPEVNKLRNKLVKQAYRLRMGFIFFEIPLLFEKSLERVCDKIIVVVTPKYIQEKRALIRPNMTKSNFNLILKTQMKTCKKKEKADFIIYNGQRKAFTQIQINQIRKKLCAKSF